MGPLTETKLRELETTIETNFLAPVIVSRAAHKYLEQTGGQVLLFTSSSYTRGRANYGVYSASKAAVVNLTQALAEEWAPEGVRINCVNPQRTRTPMRTHGVRRRARPRPCSSPSTSPTSACGVLARD